MPLPPPGIFTADFGTFAKPYTAFVTLAELALYFFFSLRVSLARRRHKVPPPATDGPDAFLRVLRVHANTAEQLVLHLPLLWIAAFAMDDVFAAAFGAVWVLGRVLYARGYYQKPKRRAKGHLICSVVNAILFAGALAGVAASF